MKIFARLTTVAALLISLLVLGGTIAWGALEQPARALFAHSRRANAELTAWQVPDRTERRHGTRDAGLISPGNTAVDDMTHPSLGDRIDPASANEVLLASPDIFSEEQKSAAMRVELAGRRLLAIRNRCVGRDGGDSGRFVWHLAEIENLDVTLPANKVLATIPAEQYRKLLGTIHDDTRPTLDRAGCEQFVADLLRKDLVYYAIAEPAAVKILRAIYAGDEAMRIIKRDADLTAGCIKHAYNAGARMFAITRARCECNTRAIKHHANDAQIDAWLATLDTKPSPDWMVKALSEVQQCSSAAQ